jgi:hypothetical protein
MFGVIKLSGNMVRPGDVIYAQRNNYQHYGIYAGKSRVIHFVGEKGDWWANVMVRETSLEKFAKGDPVFLCRFPKTDKSHYSRYATLRRAKSKLGTTGFNLVFNNCEHFARWCKTGWRDSLQVQEIMRILTGEQREPRELPDDIGMTVLNAVDNAVEGIYTFSDMIDDLSEKVMAVLSKLEAKADESRRCV